MVTLARYLRDLPPNEGCRWKKRSQTLPSGCGRRKATFDSLYRKNTSFNPSFNENIKQSTSFQAIYTRATLICIDLSLSILSIKLLICNLNGETNLPLSYSTIRYPVDLPDKQCLWALKLTLKYLIPPFSYIYGWPLVNTGKNDKKGKPFAAKGWPRSLNKGGYLLKMTITMFVLYAGKFEGFENSSLNTVKTNN